MQEQDLTLALALPVEETLGALAESLRNEMAVCLIGVTDQKGQVAVTGLEFPWVVRATNRSVSSATCDNPETVARWHNHPPHNAPRERQDKLCAMSPEDVAAAKQRGHPITIVQVDARRYCWWTAKQITEVRAGEVLPSIPRQRSF